jgi:hypothetical protein
VGAWFGIASRYGAQAKAISADVESDSGINSAPESGVST